MDSLLFLKKATIFLNKEMESLPDSLNIYFKTNKWLDYAANCNESKNSSIKINKTASNS